ncbi:MAG: hypothetical protein QM796_13115 [Chthoniobacteraceae bacterium]
MLKLIRMELVQTSCKHTNLFPTKIKISIMRYIFKTLGIIALVAYAGLYSASAQLQPSPVQVDDANINTSSTNGYFIFNSGIDWSNITVPWTTATKSAGQKLSSYTYVGNTYGYSKMPTAIVKAALPESGVYKIQMWWPNIKTITGKATAPTTKIQVSFMDSTGIATAPIEVNQTSISGKWVNIGSYSYQKSPGVPKALVTITAEYYTYALIDAIRFVKVDPTLVDDTNNVGSDSKSSYPSFRAKSTTAWSTSLGSAWSNANGTTDPYGNSVVVKKTSTSGASILVPIKIVYPGKYHVYCCWPNYTASGTADAQNKRSQSVGVTVCSNANGTSALLPTSVPNTKTIQIQQTIDESKYADSIDPPSSPDEVNQWYWVGDYIIPQGSVTPSVIFTNNCPTTGAQHNCIVEEVRFDLCTDTNYTYDAGYSSGQIIWNPFSAWGGTSANTFNQPYPSFGPDRLCLRPWNGLYDSWMINIGANISGRYGVYVYVSSETANSPTSFTANISMSSSSRASTLTSNQTFPITPGNWNAIGTAGTWDSTKGSGNVVLFTGDETVSLTLTPTAWSGRTANIDAVRLVPISIFDTGNGVDDAIEKGLYNGNILSSAQLSSQAVSGTAQNPLTITQALALSLDPTVMDTDQDGMPDAWEVNHGLNPLVDDSASDPDNDGLLNWQEYLLGTNPQNAYSINAINTDGNQDANGDGIPNAWEFQAGTWSLKSGVWTLQSGPNPLPGYVPSPGYSTTANSLDPTAQGTNNSTGMTYLQRYNNQIPPTGEVVFDTVAGSAEFTNGIYQFILNRISPSGSAAADMRGKTIEINYDIGKASMQGYGKDYILQLNGNNLASSGSVEMPSGTNTLILNVVPISSVSISKIVFEVNNGFYNTKSDSIILEASKQASRYMIGAGVILATSRMY